MKKKIIISSIIASVIDGFLYAVYAGKLEVIVDNITINASSLPSIIENYKECFSEHAENYYDIIYTLAGFSETCDVAMAK